MKKYFINLDSRKDRLTNMLSNKYSYTFTRIKAIHFDEISSIYLTENPELVPAEIACFLSHLKIWKIVALDFDIKDDEYVLISEDDVVFNENTEDILNKISKCNNYHAVRFIQCINHNANNKIEIRYVKPNSIDRTSTACYLIKKSLCKELVRKFSYINTVHIVDLFSQYIEESVGLLDINITSWSDTANQSDISVQTDSKVKELLINSVFSYDNWCI